MEPRTGEVTRLLNAWTHGDEKALEPLMPLVYSQLQRIARRRLDTVKNGHTLPSAGLLHEAYLELVDSNVEWRNRGHFFAVASRAMRCILLDHAKRKMANKRGGGDLHLSIGEVNPPAPTELDVIALNNALKALAAIDRRKSRIIELRYFGGLTIEETAEVLQVSVATVKNDWTAAKAWLYRQLSKK
jgi:RNA polymerase sigma factor (TIGR02999 family)